VARTPVRQFGWETPAAAPGVPVAAPGAGHGEGPSAARVDRMARFVAGARRAFARVLAVAGLLLAGLLLAVAFALLGGSPAAADDSAVAGDAGTGSAVLEAPAGPVASSTGEFPAADGFAPAPGDSGPIPDDFAPAPDVPDNAEAMAGLGVDGLTSQSTPVLPMPATADQSLGAHGYVPQGSGGSGLIGPVSGDLARSIDDARFTVQRVPLAVVLPPVVRTAADEPSFSPD
jgi:hypothetical protein